MANTKLAAKTSLEAIVTISPGAVVIIITSNDVLASNFVFARDF